MGTQTPGHLVPQDLMEIGLAITINAVLHRIDPRDLAQMATNGAIRAIQGHTIDHLARARMATNIDQVGRAMTTISMIRLHTGRMAAQAPGHLRNLVLTSQKENGRAVVPGAMCIPKKSIVHASMN
jgi:hypothetical protein